MDFLEQLQVIIDQVKDTLEVQFHVIEDSEMTGKDHRLLTNIVRRFKGQFQSIESMVHSEIKEKE